MTGNYLHVATRAVRVSAALDVVSQESHKIIPQLKKINASYANNKCRMTGGNEFLKMFIEYAFVVRKATFKLI